MIALVILLSVVLIGVIVRSAREEIHLLTEDRKQRAIISDLKRQLELITWTNSENQMRAFVNALALKVHQANNKWWTDLNTGEDIPRDTGNLMTKLILVHSEISEAVEGHRKNLMDDKLPHRPMFDVELADALIRLLDVAWAYGVDIGGVYVEKMQYNAIREDHKIESRKGDHGKRF